MIERPRFRPWAFFCAVAFGVLILAALAFAVWRCHFIAVGKVIRC